MGFTYEKRVISTFVTGFAKKVLIHASNFATLKRHNFIYE